MCTKWKTLASQISLPHTGNFPNNLFPLVLHFAVSLGMKSASQLWRALGIKREGINKQANCGTYWTLRREQENIFPHGY